MSYRIVPALIAALSLGAWSCKKDEGSASSEAKDPSTAEVTAAGATETAAPAEGKAAGTGGGEPDPKVTHEVSGSGPDSIGAGEKAALQVSVKPLGGWKINTDKAFPTKLKITVPDGVTVSGDSFDPESAKSFGEKGAEFTFEATPAAAGTYEIEADLRFAVCSETSCIPKRETVKVALSAE